MARPLGNLLESLKQLSFNHAHGVSGATFARTLACPDDLLHRLDAIPRLPDVLVVDLSTNDRCSQDASPGLVVDKAFVLVDLLIRQQWMPNTVFFLSVIQRASKGRHLQPDAGR